MSLGWKDPAYFFQPNISLSASFSLRTQVSRRRIAPHNNSFQPQLIMPPLSTMDAQDTWDDSKGCSCSNQESTIWDADKSIRSPLHPRKVSFSSNVAVKEMQHRRDIPAEEVSATWYNNTDFAEIKKSIIVTLRCIVAKRPLGDGQCSRGLESRTPEGAKLRKVNRINALTAVWHAQVDQWESNTINEKAIASVYQVQSAICKKAAHRAAMYDEQVVRLYQGLTVSQPEPIDAGLFETLVVRSNDRRKSVRDDMKQFVGCEKKQTTQPKKASCAPSAA